MANNAFGIDLGTNNIKIYSRSDDNIVVEKNMIAIENKNTLFAYGDSAFLIPCPTALSRTSRIWRL